MNKRFSTLVAAFAALTVVSSAQVKYVQLSTTAGALTWTTEAAKDSVSFKTYAGTKAEKDSALWEVKFAEKLLSGDSAFTFVNKATGKNLSFAKKSKTTKIAVGVDKFVFSKAGNSAIYAADGDKSVLAIGTTNGTLVTGATAPVSGAAEFTIATAGSNILDVAELGNGISSVKLDFAGKDGGLFTATELVITDAASATIKFQVKESENSAKGSKAAQYITIDTMSYAGNVYASKFQLDTLVASGVSAYKGNGNAALQEFTVSQDLSTDVITLSTGTKIAFGSDGKYTSTTTAGAPFKVGYKDLAGTKVLTIDNVAITPAAVSVSMGTVAKLPNGTGVYAIKMKNASKTTNGKYLVGDGFTGAAAATVYTPSTQFYIKENANGTYSAQARELSTGIFFADQELFAVAGVTNGYKVRTMNADTLIITPLAVNLADKHVGYKYFDKEELANTIVSLNLSSIGVDDIYLTLKNDSILTGSKTTVKEALKVRFGAKVNLSNDTIQYGAQALGDTLVRVAYSWEQPFSTNYVAIDGKTVKLTSTTPTAERFYFIEKAEGAYQVSTTSSTSAAILMNPTTLTVSYDAVNDENRTLFSIATDPAPLYLKPAAGHYQIKNGYEMLTANKKGAAAFLREDDILKASVADTVAGDDFKLWIDTAYVNADKTEYAYYIFKGASYAGDTIVGNVLTAKGKFVNAPVAGDSAIFAPAKMIADSIWYDSAKTTKVLNTKSTSLMLFEVLESGDLAIVLQNAKAKKLASVNGTVVFTDMAEALPVTFAESVSTGNEEAPSVSTISVIASEGQVTISGAEGKKVAISNILGQVIANTVITSNNAVISVPAGIVVVAVEGETAVKAIVK